jgi:hypothetical protein
VQQAEPDIIKQEESDIAKEQGVERARGEREDVDEMEMGIRPSAGKNEEPRPNQTKKGN